MGYQPISFFCSFENLTLVSPLVNKSSNCSSVAILTSSIWQGPICSLNQWYLIAQCFGLGVILQGSILPRVRAPTLSLCILMCSLACLWKTCLSNENTKHISFVTLIREKRSRQDVLRVTYSASIVDNAISVCSLLFHRIGQLAREMT